MAEATSLGARLDAIVGETAASFAWLAAGLERERPVSFVPNPGNIGDAAINLACWRFLAARFATVEICLPIDVPTHRAVFIAGGGNLVAPLYDNLAACIRAHGASHDFFIFPSTILGNEKLLDRIAGNAMIVSREAISHRHVRAHLPPARTLLGHDAAFALAPWLRKRFAARIARRPARAARLFRNDAECAGPAPPQVDLLGSIRSDWNDIALAENAVETGCRFLLGAGTIHTDRLHGAILSAMLGREVVFRANSYFKNAAVFAHSLSRLGTVTFVEPAP